jgi:hypothetical protein
VTAGSTCAVLQSIGAAGLGVAGIGVAAAGGAVVVGGYGAYKGVQWYRNRNRGNGGEEGDDDGEDSLSSRL